MHKRTAIDAFNMLAGDKIGGGVYRDVFTCKIRPDLVVKVELASGNKEYRSFENVFEMKFYNDNFHYKALSKWLAKAEFLSPDGYILLQERVRVCTDDDIPKLPKMLPSFLTDTKAGNFGFTKDGRLVCIDYALHIANPSIKLRKANWW